MSAPVGRRQPVTARRFDRLRVVETLGCGHEIAYDVRFGSYRAVEHRVCRACATPPSPGLPATPEERRETPWQR